MVDFARSLAIVIGINHYQSGISPLNTAVNDATEFARILKQEHGYQIRQFLDGEANLETLNHILSEDLPNQLAPDDRLLFYFAGHGIARSGDDRPEGFLIPQDAKLNDFSTYLPMQELHRLLTHLPCRHFLGILDCCFAGAFRWSTTRDIAMVPEVIYRERYDRFIIDPAWQIITSTAYDQKALDTLSDYRGTGTSQTHSPFAEALFEALQGNADIMPPAKEDKPAGDGVITTTELYLYLRDRVEVTTLERNQRQTPGLWFLNKHDRGEFIFLNPQHALNLPPAPPLDTTQNPYQGLASFDQAHSHLFFGRTTLIESLHEFVANHTLTVVLGVSGSGKSSLVKAGLLPNLISKTASDLQQWCILPPIRPGESPLQTLQSIFDRESVSTVDTVHSPTTITQSISEKLSNIIATWINSHADTKLLLVIDQCEELFTVCRDSQEREQFINALVEAIATHPNRFRLVLTLRSDFEPQFQHTPLNLHWSSARFWVTPMNREELRQVIEQPAESQAIDFEPRSLVDRLVDEVIQMPGALPLLSFTLSELYLKLAHRWRTAQLDGQIAARVITQQDYDELGGVIRSLTHQADQTYQTLIRQQQVPERSIRSALLRMVAGDSREPTRRRVMLSELDYPEPEHEQIQQVIQCFSQARLLVGGTNIVGQPYVEPAHDALIHGWTTLQQWVRDHEETLKLHRDLRDAAIHWQQKDKRSGFCLSRAQMKEVEVFTHAEAISLNRLEQTYIQTSQRVRRNDRLRMISASVAGLLVVGSIAWWLQREAWTDRQLRSAMFTVPTPENAQIMLKRLPDRLKRADQARQQGNIDKALEDYRTILAAMKRLQREMADDPKRFTSLLPTQRTIQTLALTAETSLAETIRQYRLPQLQAELQQGKFGKLVDPDFSKFEDQYTGALRTTYAILMGETGAKADLNSNGELNDYEEELFPCPTLQEIEALWSQFTDRRCGWYGADSAYDAPECSELEGFSLTVKIAGIPSSRYLIERRLSEQCKILPVPAEPESGF